MTEVNICIPARFASTRLPGKPLIEMAGKPLILWAIESALQLDPNVLVVATDDERIVSCVKKAGYDAIMTRKDHATGTDRLAECAQLLNWSDETIVLNHQGDEPLVPMANSRLVIESLKKQPKASIATLYQAITCKKKLLDPNVVKLVVDSADKALYFSRAPIPWQHSISSLSVDDWPTLNGAVYKHHIGLYAYRVSFLKQFAEQPQNVVEKIESLEQLRALSMGHTIIAKQALEDMPNGIDTPEDVAAFIQHIKETQV